MVSGYHMQHGNPLGMIEGAAGFHTVFSIGVSRVIVR
jgi:hypothetical protein